MAPKNSKSSCKKSKREEKVMDIANKLKILDLLEPGEKIAVHPDDSKLMNRPFASLVIRRKFTRFIKTTYKICQDKRDKIKWKKCVENSPE